MQKIHFHFQSVIGSIGSFVFLYFNISNLVEAAQAANIIVTTIGSIGSCYLIAVRIHRELQKMKKNDEEN